VNNTRLFETWRHYLKEDEGNKDVCDELWSAATAGVEDAVGDEAIKQGVMAVLANSNPQLIKTFLYQLGERLGVRLSAGAFTGAMGVALGLILTAPDIYTVATNEKCHILFKNLLADFEGEIENKADEEAKKKLKDLLAAGPQAEV
tara:strand:- start:1005 stop:1442 length:438 start_codon:yes stop_codon:yes gene_type:complete